MMKIRFHPQEADLFDNVQVQELTIAKRHPFEGVEIDTDDGLKIRVREDDGAVEVMFGVDGDWAIQPTASNVWRILYNPSERGKT